MKFFAERGETPTRYLAKIGAVNERLLAGHCIHMTQADIEILAEGNAAIAHCIGSNTKAGKGVARWRRRRARAFASGWARTGRPLATR